MTLELEIEKLLSESVTVRIEKNVNEVNLESRIKPYNHLQNIRNDIGLVD